MSSTIPYSSTSGSEPLDELESAGIAHFDATLRRKEKMRQAAANKQHAVATPSTKPSNGSNGGPAAVSVAAPAPAPPAPAAPVQQPIPAAPAAQPSASPRLSGPELEQFLVDFVVEQTGYPAEMVELDADLEADLGIDSIKKAQLFGELANDFDVKPSDDFSLDDFPTLRHVFRLLNTLPDSATAGSAVSVAAVEAPAAVQAPAPAPQTAPTTASPALSGAALEEFLVNFVVEQTGYPPEMVELDADLEADLGIDSIKKAQLFGELANEFNVQAQDDLSLDDFPTLRHVKEFLEGASTESTPATSAPVADANVGAAFAEPAVAGSALTGVALDEYLVNFVVEQTGYPPEMVELDADLEADLGIDSIKKAQLFGELANEFNVQASDDLSLDDFPTLRHVKTFLESA